MIFAEALTLPSKRGTSDPFPHSCMYIGFLHSSIDALALYGINTFLTRRWLVIRLGDP